MRTLAALLALALVAGSPATGTTTNPARAMEPSKMKLGNFSVSLAVKDLAASRTFYEALGFVPAFGDASKGWLILVNGDTKIGLFQGMFDKNILTFNPGWSASGEPLAEFTDVREIQKALKAKGVPLTTEADEKSDGPASFTVADPDGNAILFDQHVPRPTGSR